MAKKNRPLLSIGIIFRDDVRCIQRCLESLEPLRKAIPSQLVMADTGSVDGSRAIAEQYADEVFEFPWVNDFSAARNAVMDRCTGKWYFTVDTDEWLDSDFRILLQYLKQREVPKAPLISVIQRNFLFPNDERQYSDFFATRLVWMASGLRYRGKIHETLGHSGSSSVLMKAVVLKHDGYAINPEKKEEKSARNLALLEQELEQNPNDLRRLVQCIESCYSLEKNLEFAKQGIQIYQSGQGERVDYAVRLYCYGVRSAAALGEVEQAKQWLEEAKSIWPNSIFLRVDAEGYLFQQLYLQNQFVDACNYGLAWEQGVTDFDQGNFDERELAMSCLNFAMPSIRAMLRSGLLDTLCRVGAWKEAGKILEEIEIPLLEESNFQIVVRLLFQHGAKMPQVNAVLSGFWYTLERELQEAQSEEKAKWEGWKTWLLKQMNDQFAGDGRTGNNRIAEAIANLEHCDPGRSARILLTDDPEQMQVLLEEIEDWNWVLPNMIPYVMVHGILLPDGFYSQPSEAMTNLATVLANTNYDITKAALTYASVHGCDQTPARLLWMIDVVAVSLQKCAWHMDQEGAQLCRLFVKLEENTLKQFYQPTLLEGKNCSVLPAIHRFGWYVVQGLQALERDDSVEYIRCLKASLLEASNMKRAVEFMADHIALLRPIQEVPQELLDLAINIKTMLSAYPENDPAVLQIKASPVYQRVAYLIEEPAVPWNV